MLNTNLTHSLKEEFANESGGTIIADNNPADFAVFLHEKLISAINGAIDTRLKPTLLLKHISKSFAKT